MHNLCAFAAAASRYVVIGDDACHDVFRPAVNKDFGFVKEVCTLAVFELTEWLAARFFTLLTLNFVTCKVLLTVEIR
jgi:hypothetical protein